MPEREQGVSPDRTKDVAGKRAQKRIRDTAIVDLPHGREIERGKVVAKGADEGRTLS